VRQHGADDSGDYINVNRQAKIAERRNKLSIRTGKDTELKAKLVKTFRNVGDVKNDTAGL
jgi:hypothetical protein